MVGLTLAMIAARRRHALAVFALAALAIAAAVAGPAYALSTAEGVVAAGVAATPSRDKSVLASDYRYLIGHDARGQQRVAESNKRDFDRTATELLHLTGFASVFAVGVDVDVATRTADLATGAEGEPPPDITTMEFREGFCQHVVVVTGRCVAGPGEALMSAAAADAVGIAPGSVVAIRSMKLITIRIGPTGVSGGPAWLPMGSPGVIPVVGTYLPVDRADPYWGELTASRGRFMMPMLVHRPTLAAYEHEFEEHQLLLYPGPGAITASRLAQLRAETNSTLARAKARGLVFGTSLPRVLDRFTADLAQVNRTATVGSILLVALCWYVIFLAVTQTAAVRRAESGLLKLRGATAADRGWLAAAETLVPVLAGSAAGYLLGYAGTWAFARLSWPEGGPHELTVSTEGLLYAGAALVGIVVAGAFALRRDLTRPATELLRRVPPRSVAWHGLVGRTVVAALSVAALVQLRTADPGSGLSLLAPGLLIVALAMLVAGGFDPAARWFGRRALDRGRVGLALAALQLGRRRTGSRVLVLIVVAAASFGYAAIAADVGDRARRQQVGLTVGSPTVLDVSTVPASKLLQAVRQVDPAGRFAMAAAVLTELRSVPVLALDASRMDRVLAAWPDGGGARTASEATAVLHPTTAAPVIVEGTQVELEVSAEAEVGERSLSTVDQLTLGLRLAVGDRITYAEMVLRPGTARYRLPVDCAAGCRLVDLTLVALYLPTPTDVHLTVREIAQVDPPRRLAGGADFAGWHAGTGATGLAGPDGLELRLSSVSSRVVLAIPPDRPGELPILWAGPPGVVTMRAAPDLALITAPAGTVPVVPGRGTRAGVLDLDLLTRGGEPVAESMVSQVWLGAAAPPDTVERLRAAGLDVIGERRLDRALATSQGQPGAVGLRFLVLVAAVGVLLGAAGLGVTGEVELKPRAEELRALRLQGLCRRSVGVASLYGYLALGIGGCVLGAATAMAVWFATGTRMPIFDASAPGVGLARWPDPALLVPYAVAAGAVATVAVLVALALVRAARLGRRRDLSVMDP